MDSLDNIADIISRMSTMLVMLALRAHILGDFVHVPLYELDSDLHISAPPCHENRASRHATILRSFQRGADEAL